MLKLGCVTQTSATLFYKFLSGELMLGPWVANKTCKNASFNHSTRHVQQGNAIYRYPLHIRNKGGKKKKQYKMSPCGFITVWKRQMETYQFICFT